MTPRGCYCIISEHRIKAIRACHGKEDITFFMKYMRKSRGQCRLSNALCYFRFKSYVSGTRKCGQSKTK